jgi:hypothetical protein
MEVLCNVVGTFRISPLNMALGFDKSRAVCFHPVPCFILFAFLHRLKFATAFVFISVNISHISHLKMVPDLNGSMKVHFRTVPRCILSPSQRQSKFSAKTVFHIVMRFRIWRLAKILNCANSTTVHFPTVRHFDRFFFPPLLKRSMLPLFCAPAYQQLLSLMVIPISVQLIIF